MSKEEECLAAVIRPSVEGVSSEEAHNLEFAVMPFRVF